MSPADKSLKEKKDIEQQEIENVEPEALEEKIESRSRLKIFAYIGSALLVVIISGLVLWMFISSKGTAPTEEVKATKADGSADPRLGESPSAALTKAIRSNYVDLNDFIVELRDGANVLSCDLTLVMRPDYDKQGMENESRLRKIIYRELAEKKTSQLIGQLNIKVLKAELRSKINQLLNDASAVQEILITRFTII